MGYKGSLAHKESPNLTSTRDHPEIVSEKIKKECSLGRLAGPFKEKPFTNFSISPIGLVPKKEEGKFRLIHHLSYPQGESINDGIPDTESIVQYQSIDEAVALITHVGQNCYLAKTDIAEAFRIVPLHPSEYPLFGMFWNGHYYFDKCLPMGCRSSCRLFETLSNALQWMANTKLNIPNMAHVLDDFLIVDRTHEICQNSLRRFLALCANLGIPTAPEKTTQPTRVLTFLGYELDTHKMEIRLPPDKLIKGKSLVEECLTKKKAQLRFLQSVIGFLNFACGAIVPGRPFLRRLISLTIGVQKPYYYIRITQSARHDLQTWDQFLSDFNGKSLLLPHRWKAEQHLRLYTDASGSIGYGAVLGNKWFHGSWDGQWLTQSITLLELYPIVLAVETWSNVMANSCVEFHSDNIAVTDIINKQTSKDEKIMFLVRRLVLMCLRFNILFRAFHIPGHKNILADALSRLQVEEFKRWMPSADKLPVPVPPLPDWIHL